VKRLAMALAALTAAGSAAACYSRGTDHTMEELPQADGKPPPIRAFGTTIHMPFRSLGVAGSERTASGSAARVPCATCHSETPEEAIRPLDQRTAFIHVGIPARHGTLTCDSCHRPPGFADFRSVRGTPILYADAIDLCAQCHGARRRDYDQGAHGGMAGYWDLDQGPRDRNHCLVCHDPHQPAIPKVMPAPLPRYRFTHVGEEHASE